MSNHCWSKFWWADWQNDPGLRLCSLGARGLWMEMLCLMALSPRPGYLVINGSESLCLQLSRISSSRYNTVRKHLDELQKHFIFSLDDGVIFSRRMVKDFEASEIGRKNAAKRSKPTLQPNGPVDDTPSARSRSRSRVQKQKQKEPPLSPPLKETNGGGRARGARAHSRARPPLSGFDSIDQISRDWNLPTFLHRFGQNPLYPEQIAELERLELEREQAEALQ